MTQRTPSNFTAWLISIGELKRGQSWVLGRATARMKSRYPEGTRFFGKVEYEKLDRRHRIALRDDELMRIVRLHELPISSQHTKTLALMLAQAFEAGRGAR